MVQGAFIITTSLQSRSSGITRSFCGFDETRLVRCNRNRERRWRLSSSVASLRLCASSARRGSFQVGDRVRVVQSVIMYHTPMNKGQPFDVQGLEGVVTKFADVYHDMPISANRPIQVMLEGSKKFIAHFEASELEKIS